MIEVIQAPAPTPNPRETQITVPTDTGSIFGGIMDFVGGLAGKSVEFATGHGTLVAAALCALGLLWAWNQPKLRGLLLIILTVMITLWVVNHS